MGGILVPSRGVSPWDRSSLLKFGLILNHLKGSEIIFKSSFFFVIDYPYTRSQYSLELQIELDTANLGRLCLLAPCLSPRIPTII